MRNKQTEIYFYTLISRLNIIPKFLFPKGFQLVVCLINFWIIIIDHVTDI